MRPLHVIVLTVLLTASAGGASALDIGGAPSPTSTFVDPAQPAQAGDGDDEGADNASSAGLPDGCEWTTRGYACTFTGSTTGSDVPATAATRGALQELARWEMPVPPAAFVNATATREDASRLALAFADGDATYARTLPGEPEIAHARIALESGTLTLALLEDGNAGGEWTVEVTVDGAHPLTVAQDGPSGGSVAFPAAVRSVTGSCVNGVCPAATSAEHVSRDLVLGTLPRDGTLTVDVAHDGREAVDVILFDAAGKRVAEARVPAEDAAALAVNTTDGTLGTWTLRVAPGGNTGTAVDVTAGFEAAEEQPRFPAMPEEPEEPQAPEEPKEPDVPEEPEETPTQPASTDASTSGVRTTSLNILGLDVRGPTGIAAYLGSAVALGLIIAVTCIMVAHRLAPVPPRRK